MIKAKVAILEGRLLTSQSEKFKQYSKSSNWLEESRPTICFDHVNRLLIGFDWPEKASIESRPRLK